MIRIEKKKRRHHSLTGRITMDLMRKAFKNVKRNRGAAGVDKISIKMYEANLENNLNRLMHLLKTDKFQPKPLRRQYIPKGKGKLRPLGIPAVSDRIAHEAIRQIINPIFEKLFHNSSHGFRPGRSCITAIEELLTHLKQGYNVVVDADIKGFFDNIPHQMIMQLVSREISDGKTLNTIKKFLQAGIMEDGKFVKTRKGTPQGGVISPLLANIVLNHLDWKMHDKGYRFVRYADDFVVLTKSMDEAEKALKFITSCIEEDLDLQLSKEKTKIATLKEGFEFLGFYISSNSIKMRGKAEEKFKEKIKDSTIRSHNLDKKIITQLNRIIRGTVNYFYQKFTRNLEQFRILDKWIRKRIRMMKYKRKWNTDNRRLKNKHIQRMGLLSGYELCLARKGKFACSLT